MKRRVIGLDAGGTKLLAGVMDTGGELLFRRAYLWPASPSLEQVQRTVLAACADARAACAGPSDADARPSDADALPSDPRRCPSDTDALHPAAIGLGLPATMDLAAGAAAGCRHLPIVGFPFRDWLATETGLPVFVDNDATLALLAESRRGAARGASDAVMLTIGTGIGGGVMSGGRLVRGARGAAGEPGHMSIDANGPPCPGDCPGRGCLEAYVSGPALAAALSRPSATEAAHAARAGDTRAADALAAMGETLGVGIASLLNLLDPDVVVIGGGLGSDAGDLLVGPAERVARERALEPAASRARMVVAELGEDAGMLGAAMLALDGAEA